MTYEEIKALVDAGNFTEEEFAKLSDEDPEPLAAPKPVVQKHEEPAPIEPEEPKPVTGDWFTDYITNAQREE